MTGSERKETQGAQINCSWMMEMPVESSKRKKTWPHQLREGNFGMDFLFPGEQEKME